MIFRAYGSWVVINMDTVAPTGTQIVMLFDRQGDHDA